MSAQCSVTFRLLVHYQLFLTSVQTNFVDIPMFYLLAGSVSTVFLMSPFNILFDIV